MGPEIKTAPLTTGRERWQGVPPVPQTADLLTGHELAARLRVSLSTLYRWRARGLVKPVQIGGATRWPASIVDDALAGRLGAGAEGAR